MIHSSIEIVIFAFLLEASSDGSTHMIDAQSMGFKTLVTHTSFSSCYIYLCALSPMGCVCGAGRLGISWGRRGGFATAGEHLGISAFGSKRREPLAPHRRKSNEQQPHFAPFLCPLTLYYIYFITRHRQSTAPDAAQTILPCFVLLRRSCSSSPKHSTLFPRFLPSPLLLQPRISSHTGTPQHGAAACQEHRGV